MTVVSGMSPSRTYLALFVLLCAMGSRVSHAADSAKSADESYLDALQGTWKMEGTLRGKPVRYLAHGQWVLQKGFMKLHMLDTGAKSPYEADVFIGYDAKANDYIAHWLDRFGAAGARVVARGERRGQQLLVLFPYENGAFRDTFTWQPARASWTLLLESQEPDGSWSTFASYTLTRGTPH